VSAWPVTTLGDICDIRSGDFTPAVDRDASESVPVYGANGVIGFSRLANLSEPAVLIGRVGSVGAVVEPAVPARVTDNALICRPGDAVDTGYLAMYLWHFRPERLKSASMQPLLTGSSLRRIPVPVPPLDEQRRIAAHLRDQRDNSDAMRLWVESRIETLAQVREEVLASTFARIEAQTIALGAAVSAPGAIADGPFGSHLKTEHYARRGVRVIRLQNIGSGKFLDHDRAFVTREHADTLTRHTALEGDVVVAALGDGARPAGRACQVPDIGPALVKADCFRVRTDGSPVDPEFLVWFLNSPRTQATIAGQMRGATRPRVTLAMLKAFAVPLPSLADQRRIAARLREQLAEIDRAKAALETQRKAIVALPAALLREVFGEVSAA